MTTDTAHFTRKHPADANPEPAIAKAIADRCAAEGLACADAAALADELGVEPARIGRTADLTEVRLVRCQLGLFGWPETPEEQALPDEPARSTVEAAIQRELVRGGLPCARAWAIADEIGIPRMAVAAVCNAAGIKIIQCQLGAFG